MQLDAILDLLVRLRRGERSVCADEQAAGDGRLPLAAEQADAAAIALMVAQGRGLIC